MNSHRFTAMGDRTAAEQSAGFASPALAALLGRFLPKLGDPANLVSRRDFSFQFERVHRISRLIGRTWGSLPRVLPTIFTQYAEH